MAGADDTPIIHFDYEFSPLAQKTKLLLTLAGVPFERVDLPTLIPRKDLESIGVYYRRVPILAVGKDLYCDSKSIFEDGAWEVWGFVAFSDTLGLIPDNLMSDAFIKTIYPMLGRSDYKTLRPSGVADLRSKMTYLEHTVLRDTPYIGGDQVSVADIHAIWGVRWDLNNGDAEPPGLSNQNERGVGKDAFPKVWRLIESLPATNGKTIAFNEAWNKIKDSKYTSGLVDVMKDEPTAITAGTDVTVDSLGSDPYKHPTSGKLVGTATNEIVIEVPTGLRLHFPREGQILREAKK